MKLAQSVISKHDVRDESQTLWHRLEGIDGVYK